MTKRVLASPSDGSLKEAKEADREDAWNRVIAGLEERQRAAVLESTREQLSKQQEVLASLLEQLDGVAQREAAESLGLLEGARALRVGSAEAAERVQALERQNAELQGKLDKAELSVAVVREEVSALEDQLAAIRKEHKRLEAEGKEREQRVRQADDKVAKAEAARKMAADQLNEALESLTEMGLEKAENERKIADLEGGFEAVKEERAAAEERWNAADDERIRQVRELKNRIEHLEAKIKAAETAQENLASTEQQEREALEQAWKEATEQREALAALRAEAKERIETLEQQQEEFIANLVDDYDDRLAEAKRELEELRAKSDDGASLKQAQSERDAALENMEALRIELGTTREQAKRAAELQSELETLRADGGGVAADEHEALRQDLARVQSELDEARAGVDQLLTDCDRLNAENVRLTLSAKELEGARPSIPLDLDDTEDMHDAVGMLEARASSPMLEDFQSPEKEVDGETRQNLARLETELEGARAELERYKAEHQREGGRTTSNRKRQVKRSSRASVRKERASSAEGEPLTSSPSSHPDEDQEDGTTRRAGSYSLIGGEFATETVSGKKKRGSD